MLEKSNLLMKTSTPDFLNFFKKIEFASIFFLFNFYTFTRTSPTNSSNIPWRHKANENRNIEVRPQLHLRYESNCWIRPQHEIVRSRKTSKPDVEWRENHERDFWGAFRSRLALLYPQPASWDVPVQLYDTTEPLRRPRDTSNISQRRKHQHEKLRDIPGSVRVSKLQQKRNHRITQWLSILWKPSLSRTKLLSKFLICLKCELKMTIVIREM